jgi:hypothetical protein
MQPNPAATRAISIQINPALMATIEAAAAAEGKSFNDWVIERLEGAQEIAGRRMASDEERKRAEARAEKWMQDKLERLGHSQTQSVPESAVGQVGTVYLRPLRGRPRAA